MKYKTTPTTKNSPAPNVIKLRVRHSALVSWSYHRDQSRCSVKDVINDGNNQSVQLLTCVTLFAAPQTAAHQAFLSICPAPRACSNSCPLSWWCHPTISFFVVPFSSCLQSFPASGSFLMSWLLVSGGQTTGASASVVPMNIRGWFPLGLTGLIFLQSKGLSRVFSNTTLQKHQFFSAQLSFWSNSHIHSWLLEKTYLCLYGHLWAK